jgi:hypothetical protein
LDEEQAQLEAATSALAAREAALAGRQAQLEALEGAAAEALQEARDAAAAALAERDQVSRPCCCRSPGAEALAVASLELSNLSCWAYVIHQVEEPEAMRPQHTP